MQCVTSSVLLNAVKHTWWRWLRCGLKPLVGLQLSLAASPAGHRRVFFYQITKYESLNKHELLSSSDFIIHSNWQSSGITEAFSSRADKTKSSFTAIGIYRWRWTFTLEVRDGDWVESTEQELRVTDADSHGSVYCKERRTRLKILFYWLAWVSKTSRAIFLLRCLTCNSLMICFIFNGKSRCNSTYGK